MTRRRIIWGLLALAVIAIVVTNMVLGAQGNVPEVTTAHAEEGDLTVVVTVSGRVGTDEKADVFPKTAGAIEEILVADGDTVEAGQVLARLETDAARLEIAMAEAGYQAALAGLKAIDAQLPSSTDKAAADAQVDTAYTSYDVARDAYDALKDAYDQAPEWVQPSMEATLTQLEMAKDQAYAGYLGAKSAREALDRQSDVAAQKASAEAQVEQAALSLDMARARLADAEITAPIDGVVIFNTGVPGLDGSAQPQAVVGASVSPAAAPFTIVRLGALDFVGEVDEADVDAIEPGMRAEVLLDSFPDMTFATEVTRVDSVSQVTLTGAVVFPAHLPLRETGQDILIGMQGSADIEVAMVEGVITVPIEALFGEEDEDVLYVLDGDVVERRVVEVGRLTETDVEIVEGIEDGEEVALTGVDALEDGITVRRVEPDESMPGGFGGGPFGG